MRVFLIPRAFFLGLASAAAAVLSSGHASAAVLVGFHAFTANAGIDDSPITSTAGFTGVVNKTAAGLSNGGSDADTYGDGFSPIPSTPGGDGAVKLSFGSATFTVTNNSLSAHTLTTIYFDAAHLAGPSLTHNIQVTYSPDAEEFELLGTFTSTASVPNNGVATYQNFAIPVNIILGVGESITVQFRSDSARIDNVAFADSMGQIPEPGSALVLTSLAGTALFLRSRRQSRPA